MDAVIYPHDVVKCSGISVGLYVNQDARAKFGVAANAYVAVACSALYAFAHPFLNSQKLFFFGHKDFSRSRWRPGCQGLFSNRRRS